MAKCGNNLFAGSTFDGIFISTDDGANWTKKNNGMGVKIIRGLAVYQNNIFVGTSEGIFFSSNYGDNWIEKDDGLTSLDIYSIAVQGDRVIAGTFTGVFISTNNGQNWTLKNNGLSIFPATNIAIKGNNLIVGKSGGIFISTDNGDNWIKKNDGLTSISVRTMTLSENFIFAGTGIGIFRAKLSDLISDIPEQIMPNNPFSISPNPSSNTITLTYPNKMYGEPIKIFNTMGIPVWSGIADAERKTIDISGLAAGAYFLRIGKETGIFIKE
jgi:photosystem II stability/assembly factor-like uncharacterized protein